MVLEDEFEVVVEVGFPIFNKAELISMFILYFTRFYHLELCCTRQIVSESEMEDLLMPLIHLKKLLLGDIQQSKSTFSVC